MQAAWIPRSIWAAVRLSAAFAGLLLAVSSANSASTDLPLQLAQNAAPATARSTQASAAELEELVLEVDVNQQGLKDSAIVLRAADGAFFVAEEDLDRWRLRKPGVVALKHGGGNYFSVAGIPGAKFELDRVKQTLKISAGAAAFGETATKLERTDMYAAPILPQPGGFLNYNLSATRSEDANSLSGSFDAGFFSRHGSLTSGFLAPTLDTKPSLTRLQTTYTIDTPEKLLTLRLGDTTNQAGAWGMPVLFGGIQYGTNFGTQPGFVRTPTALTAGGQATLPSTVDVFVNNALVSRQSVPPGPFSISNIPIVSGTGEARLVVRDLLGREQIITQPFYGTATLLKQGLTEYSYELGVQRQNFGVASNDYGKGLASATYRRGLTETLTSEVHAEASAGTAALGSSGVVRLGQIGVANGSIAASHGDAGSGRLLSYGFERQGKDFSFSMRSQLADSSFRQIGLLPGQPPRRRQDVVSMGLPLGRLGSVSLSRVGQKSADQPGTVVTSLGYTLQLGRLAQLGVTAMRTESEVSSNSIFMTLSIPLGTNTSASIASERTRAADGSISTSMTNTLQQGMPVGPGYGYRLQEREGSYLGNLSLQNNAGSYQIEASQARDGVGGTPIRLSAAGGIGVVGGHAFFSRAITDSFGVVRVADYPNVRVLQDNQVVGRTDAGGYAVLPRLRAYDKNIVSVDQGDLPMDAIMGSLKLVATPYYRSGVLIDFPVKRERGGTLRIMLEDGSELPSGALSKIEGKDEEFPVALHGEAYLTGFEAQNRIQFSWKGQRCVIDVAYPEKTAEALPHLGTFICKGVQP